uniref:Peptidase M12B domain-containing protein n=1 Tax=Meloidogyne hapla TaxID=6305 RepID=A0A1I8BSX3_MELHA
MRAVYTDTNANNEAQNYFKSTLTSIIPSNKHPLRRHHRWRRAPAVWGDPAPDYSLAALDPRINIYLYALLFVDLKTSDHYRRDHTVVKREVMRLAKEANNYFYQINLRLIVVDVLETFRDDLSLYTFELYRNSRMAQLPFHDFAVLISYRYAGGLAFVGGMCNSKSVMLAGFYPHNPEAMASIFFHEVAHLVGVPHRPENETLDVPNCACNNLNNNNPEKQRLQNKRENKEGEKKLESKSSVLLDKRLSGTGCLKIPGFDQDCTLQLMVNMALRTRCLLREPKAEAHTSSLSICGNGVHEEGEQCDCGLADKCNEWNCEPEKCIRRWPIWAVWLLAIILGIIASVPFLLWLLFPCAVARLPQTSVTSQHWPANKCRRRYYHFFVPIPPFVGEENNNKIVKNNGKTPQKASIPISTKQVSAEQTTIRTLRLPFIEWLLTSRLRAVWERIKWSICSGIIVRRRRKRLKSQLSAGCQNSSIIRPIRPPPPPPPLLKNNIGYSSNTLNRPKRPPPPLPPLPTSSGTFNSLIRPKILPPSPPCKLNQIEINNNERDGFIVDEAVYDENKWNDDFDDD